MKLQDFPKWRHFAVLGWIAATSLLSSALCGTANGQISALADANSTPETVKEGAWLRTRADGRWVNTRIVNLAPKAEAKPALKHALIPQPFDMVDGNAAIYYMHALAFNEQTNAREAMTKFEREGWEKVKESGGEPEPYSWMETLPEDLPVERVKSYLINAEWQKRFLKMASERNRCDFDRNIRAVEDPISYLLPEIQQMRQLARIQSMRSRLAICENRTEDAFEIFGQQLALARHLDQDLFLVTNLVGIACASIGIGDAYFMSEHKDAANMYWALASLPSPLVSMRDSLSYEREFAFEQFKVLRQVDAEPRPAGYWKDVVKELSVALDSAYQLSGGLQNSGAEQLQLATIVAISYPNACSYLVDETEVTQEQIDAMPNTQVVLLAMRKMHEYLRDEVFKIQYLSNYQRDSLADPEEVLREATAKYGLLTTISELFLPAIKAASQAADRLETQLRMLRIVESMRDHLVTHEGLPESLDELRLPAPLDPVTGKNFSYQLIDGKGTLLSSVFPGYQIKLVLVPPSKQ